MCHIEDAMSAQARRFAAMAFTAADVISNWASERF
jgi:hypothetical protein